MTDSHDNDDAFYVGYRPRAATASARWVRRACVAVTVLAGLAIGLFFGAQSRFADATFDFGNSTVLTGQLVADPYPALVTWPQAGGDDARPGRVHLVAFGKHGAAIDGYVGKVVSVNGTLRL